MKVRWHQEQNNLYFYFESNSGDLQIAKDAKGNPYSLRRNHCYLQMPSGWNVEFVHPDLMACVVALLIDPFIKTTIELQTPVSSVCGEVFQQLRNKIIFPIDPSLKPRKMPDISKPGLCYSGGIDSTVAAMLMPLNTLLIFTDRDQTIDEGKKPKFNTRAALHACAEMKKLGHEVEVIKSDFEYLRNPVGFMTTYSPAIPLILMADQYQLTTIAYGMTMESAFGIGSRTYTNQGSKWIRFISQLGLPISLITSGLSEVATSKIILQNDRYRNIPQSCVRGEVGKNCNQCTKCLRKNLVKLAFENQPFYELSLRKLLRIDKIYQFLTRQPLHHENVFGFIYARYKSGGIGHFLLSKQIRSIHKNTWLMRWLPESAQNLAPKERKLLLESIQVHFEPMSHEDISDLKNWDPRFYGVGLQGMFQRLWILLFTIYSYICWKIINPATYENAIKSLRRLKWSLLGKGK